MLRETDSVATPNISKPFAFQITGPNLDPYTQYLHFLGYDVNPLQIKGSVFTMETRSVFKKLP